jgi:hypothetical protein
MMDILHFIPFLLLIIPIIIGLSGITTIRKNKKLNPAIHPGKTIVINSAMAYALAFNLVFFIQELFLALGKKWLGLKGILFHNNHNWEGSHPQDMLAQGYGAAAIFIVAILSFVVLLNTKPQNRIYLFLLWFTYQGFAQSLPQFLTAMFAPDTDTGQAYNYLGIGPVAGAVITIGSTLALIMMGMFFSKLFLQLAPPVLLLNAYSRNKYLLYAILLAALLGVLMIIPFRIMPWSRAMAPVEVTIISIPVIWLNGWRTRSATGHNHQANHRLSYLMILVLVLLLLFFQLILAKGVIV